MPEPIKILLVDDHQIVLDSLRMLFTAINGVQVVKTLTDSRQVLPCLDAYEVDLVISDLHLPYLSGIDLTLQIKQHHPHIKVLLLTMAEDSPTIREAIKAGTNGYVLKKTGKEELEKAIRKVMEGKKYFSEEVIDELAHSPAQDLNDSQVSTIPHLTSREIEILRLIAQEYSSGQIAEKLFISLPTVESHRRSLMQKLNVKSVVGMTKFAVKHGLVEE
ncbi:MAG: response regulator transcription factor [Spirosomataceae bacterium]